LSEKRKCPRHFVTTRFFKTSHLKKQQNRPSGTSYQPLCNQPVASKTQVFNKKGEQQWKNPFIGY
jgi:hypothetical protein